MWCRYSICLPSRASVFERSLKDAGISPKTQDRQMSKERKLEAEDARVGNRGEYGEKRVSRGVNKRWRVSRQLELRG